MAQHFYHFRVRLLRFYTFYGSRHDSSRRVKILDGIILKRVKRLLSFFLFFIIHFWYWIRQCFFSVSRMIHDLAINRVRR